MRKRTIYILESQDKELEEVSELTGRPISELIRRAVNEYIERRNPDVFKKGLKL